MIKLNQLTLRQTGPEMALAFGCFRNIVCFHQPIYFVANIDGKLPWYVVDLPTHPAESRYATIEGEALAVANSLDKARHFVLGCTNSVIAVDHKPLSKIFEDRSLVQISNPRLRHLKEKTLRYYFRMVHIQEAKNRALDVISRRPTGAPKLPKMQLSDDIFHISHFTLLPDLNIPLQLIAGTHFED